MSRLGTCIASTAHILTVRARCALHSHHIPFIPVFTCAEHERGTPDPNAMRECEVTLTYLRDGLLTCSVVWAEFEYLTLKFIKILMQLCKNFL